MLCLVSTHLFFCMNNRSIRWAFGEWVHWNRRALHLLVCAFGLAVTVFPWVGKLVPLLWVLQEHFVLQGSWAMACSWGQSLPWVFHYCIVAFLFVCFGVNSPDGVWLRALMAPLLSWQWWSHLNEQFPSNISPIQLLPPVLPCLRDVVTYCGSPPCQCLSSSTPQQ